VLWHKRALIMKGQELMDAAGVLGEDLMLKHWNLTSSLMLHSASLKVCCKSHVTRHTSNSARFGTPPHSVEHVVLKHFRGSSCKQLSKIHNK
jgi:hypothetical protein